MSVKVLLSPEGSYLISQVLEGVYERLGGLFKTFNIYDISTNKPHNVSHWGCQSLVCSLTKGLRSASDYYGKLKNTCSVVDTACKILLHVQIFLQRFGRLKFVQFILFWQYALLLISNAKPAIFIWWSYFDACLALLFCCFVYLFSRCKAIRISSIVDANLQKADFRKINLN